VEEPGISRMLRADCFLSGEGGPQVLYIAWEFPVVSEELVVACNLFALACSDLRFQSRLKSRAIASVLTMEEPWVQAENGFLGALVE